MKPEISGLRGYAQLDKFLSQRLLVSVQSDDAPTRNGG